MKISIEMSLYPLTGDYLPSIAEFIEDLNSQSAMEVRTNALSTQISGEYDLVMSTIQTCLRKAFESGPTFSFVSKILNVDITESEYYS